MARLRFPGRPGRRYGRSLIRFMPHEARKSQNVFFNLTANIQRNLKWFYDTFGDSDEEEEFEGFTLTNVERQKYELLQQEDIFERQRKERAKRTVLQSQPVHSSGRNVRNIIRRSYAAMLRGEDDVSPILYKLKKPEELVRYGVKQEESSKTGDSSTELTSPSKLTTIKIKLLPDGKQAKIIRNRRPPRALNLDFVRDNVGPKNKELGTQEKRVKMMQEKFLRDQKARERKRQKRERERQRKEEKAQREKLKREKMREKMRQKKMKEKVKREKLQAKKKATTLAKKIKIRLKQEKKTQSTQRRNTSTTAIKSEVVETQPQRVLRKTVQPRPPPQKTEIVAARQILARARVKQRKPPADLSLMMAGKRMLKQSRKLNDMVTNVNFLHRTPRSTIPSQTAFPSRNIMKVVQKQKATRLQNAIAQRKKVLPRGAALKPRLKQKTIRVASQISDQKTPDKDVQVTSPPSATKIAGFVLPSFSARSSRAIKPCKRYLENSGELPPQKISRPVPSPKPKPASTPNRESSGEESDNSSDNSSSYSDISSESDVDYNPYLGSIELQMTHSAKFFNKKVPSKTSRVQKPSTTIQQTKNKLLSRYGKPVKGNFQSRLSLVKKPKPLPKPNPPVPPVSNSVHTIQYSKAKSPSSNKILSEKAQNRHISSKEDLTKAKVVKKVQIKLVHKTSDKEDETKPIVTSPILKEVKASHRAHLQKLAKDRRTVPLASEVKTPLHPRQFSGGDRTSHLDTVSKQLAEALEADRSPEQQNSKPTKAARPDNQASHTTPLTRGPRIKHVCRRAPLGMELATFPDSGSWTDHEADESSHDVHNGESPSKYNRKNRGANYKRFRQELMDSGVKSEETEVTNKIEVEPQVPRPMPMPPPLKRTQKLPPSREGKVRAYRRRIRCGKCGPCQQKEDCGVCDNCLDKTKFGGRNTKKQACVHKKCQNPQNREDVYPEVQTALKVPDNVPSLAEVSIPLSESPVPQVSESSSRYRPGPRKVSPFKQKLRLGKPKARIKLPTRRGALKVVTNNRPMSRAERLQMEKEKAKLKKLEANRTSSSSLTVAKQKAKPQIKPLKITHHRINIDFKEDYDIDVAWMRGIAILSSEPMVPRTVCYLCSSTGKHELIYCNVCCEPFHSFCLEDNERPLEGEEENWCCRHCKFCHVCGRQDKLLTCDKCQSSYHPECLGPNYPTKPSKRRKIWVCTKCVKCKSCGATTPGQTPNAQWSHDFSLCQDCGKLFDRGNYCPICSQCYEDNDYESKMIQCGQCDRWVHAKCEGLTDDMYHIMTDLPDSVPYNCIRCNPIRPARWQVELREELEAGFTNVIRAMYHCRSAAHLINGDKKVKHSRSSNRSTSPANSIGTSRDVTPSPALSDSPSVDSICSLAEPKTDTLPRRMSPRFLRDKSRTGSPLLRTKEQEILAKTVDSGETSTENQQPNNDVISVKSEQVDTSNISTSDNMETDQHSSHEISKNYRGTSATNVHSRSDITAVGNPSQVSTLDNFGLAEESCLSRSVDLLQETSNSRPKERANSEESVSLSEEMAVKLETSDQGKLESVVKSNTNESRGENPVSYEMGSDAIFVGSSQDSRTFIDLPDGVSEKLSERNRLENSKNVGSFLEEQRTVKPAFDPNKCASSKQDIGTPDKQSEVADFSAKMQSLEGTAPKESEQQLEAMQTEPSAEVTSPSEVIHTPGDSSSTTGPCNMDKLPLDKLTNESSEKDVTDQSAAMKSLHQTGTQTTCDANSETKNTPEMNSGTTLPSKDDVTPLDDSISSEVSLFRGLTEKPSENEQPKDLRAVNKRVKSGSYKTVADFCDDCVRIIQQSLSSETDESPNLKRNNRSACSVFLKHMTRMFPWFKVESSRCWEENQKYPVGMLSQAVLPPHSDHEYAQWKHTNHPFPTMLQPSPLKRLPFSPTSRVPARIIGGNAQAMPLTEPNTDDTRRCCLCGRFSDDDPNNGGRLLYCGQDEWIHINCGLWSAEVFEEMDGSLVNVHAAIWRGRQLRCDGCGKFGATVGCCQRGCPANFHFMCAREKDCVFQEDKKVFCNTHQEKVDRDTIQDGNFAVLRRVCVSLDNMKLNRNFAQGLEVDHINVMVGSLTVDDLGRLGPASDQQDTLYPMEFTCQRVYWSTFDARRRCVYTIRIVEYKAASTPKSPLDVNHTTSHSPGITGNRGLNRSYAHITELPDDMPSIPEMDEEGLQLGRKASVETIDGVLDFSLDSTGLESLLDPEMLMQCEAELREGGVDPDAVLSAAALEEGDVNMPMEIGDSELDFQDQASMAISAAMPSDSIIEDSVTSFQTLQSDILPQPFKECNENASVSHSCPEPADPVFIKIVPSETTLTNLRKHSNLITEDMDLSPDLNEMVVSLNSAGQHNEKTPESGSEQLLDVSSKGAVNEVKGDKFMESPEDGLATGISSLCKTSSETSCVLPKSRDASFQETKSEVSKPNSLSLTGPNPLCQTEPNPASEDTPTRSVFKFIDKLISKSAAGKTKCDSTIPPRSENGSNEAAATSSRASSSEALEKNCSQNRSLFESFCLGTDVSKQGDSQCLKTASADLERNNSESLLPRTLDNPELGPKIEEVALLEGFSMPECSDSDLPDGFFSSQDSLKFTESGADTGDDTDLSQRTRDIVTDVIELENLSKLSAPKPPGHEPPFCPDISGISVASGNLWNVDGPLNIPPGSSDVQMSSKQMVEQLPSIITDISTTEGAIRPSFCPGTDNKLNTESLLPTEKEHPESPRNHRSEDRGENVLNEVKVQPENTSYVSHSEQCFLTKNRELQTTDPVNQNSDIKPDVTKARTTELSNCLKSTPADEFITIVPLPSSKEPSNEEFNKPCFLYENSLCDSDLHADTNTVREQVTKLNSENTSQATELVEDGSLMSVSKAQEEKPSKEMIQMETASSENELVEVSTAYPENVTHNSVLDALNKNVGDSFTSTSKSQEKPSKDMIQMATASSENDLVFTAHPGSKSENVPTNSLLDPESTDVIDSVLRAELKKISEEMTLMEKVLSQKELVTNVPTPLERKSDSVPDSETTDVDNSFMSVSKVQDEKSSQEIAQKEKVSSEKELVDCDATCLESKSENPPTNSRVDPERMDFDDSVSEAQQEKTSKEITQMEKVWFEKELVGDASTPFESKSDIVPDNSVLGPETPDVDSFMSISNVQDGKSFQENIQKEKVSTEKDFEEGDTSCLDSNSISKAQQEKTSKEMIQMEKVLSEKELVEGKFANSETPPTNSLVDPETMDVDDLVSEAQQDQTSEEMIQMGTVSSENGLVEGDFANSKTKSEKEPTNSVLDLESMDIDDSILFIPKVQDEKSSEEIAQMGENSFEKELVKDANVCPERKSEKTEDNFVPDPENMDVDDSFMSISTVQEEKSSKEGIELEKVSSKRVFVEDASTHPENKSVPENLVSDPKTMDANKSVSETQEKKNHEEKETTDFATSDPPNISVATGGVSNVIVDLLPNIVQTNSVLDETLNQKVDTSDKMKCRTEPSSLEPIGDISVAENNIMQTGGGDHKRMLSDMVSLPNDDPTFSNEWAETREGADLEPAAKRIKLDDTGSDVPRETTDSSVKQEEIDGMNLQNSCENTQECLESSSSSEQKVLRDSEEPSKEAVTCDLATSAAATSLVHESSVNTLQCRSKVDSCMQNEDQSVDASRETNDSQSAILVEEPSQSQKVTQISDEFGVNNQKGLTGAEESFANMPGPSQNEQHLAVESSVCTNGNAEMEEDDVFFKGSDHRKAIDDQSVASSQCDKDEDQDQKDIHQPLRKAVVVLHDICSSRRGRTNSLSSIKSLTIESDHEDSAPATPRQSRRSSSNFAWSTTQRSKSAPNTPYLNCNASSESMGLGAARNQDGSSELSVTSKKALSKKKIVSSLDSDDSSSDDEPLAKLSDKLKSDSKKINSNPDGDCLNSSDPPEYVLDEKTGELVQASPRHSDDEASVDSSSERKRYPMRSTFSRLTRIIDTPKERAQRRKSSSSSSSVQEGSSTKNNSLSEPNSEEIKPETTPPLPRRRGRPPKSNRCINFGKESSSSKDTCTKPSSAPQEIGKRGRGRPRKVPLNITTSSQVNDIKQISESIPSGSNKTSDTQSHPEAKTKAVPKQNSTEQTEQKKMDSDSKQQKEKESTNDSNPALKLGTSEETKDKCQATSSESLKSARRWPLKRVMGDFVSNEALLDLWTALQPDMGPLKQKPKPVEVDKTPKLSDSLGQSIMPNVSKVSETSPKVSTVQSSVPSTSSVTNSPQESAVVLRRHSDASSGDTANSDYLKTVFRSHTTNQMQRAKPTDPLITCRQVVTMSVEDLLKMKNTTSRRGRGRGAAKTGRNQPSKITVPLYHGRPDRSSEMSSQVMSEHRTLASESANQHTKTYSLIKSPSQPLVTQESDPAKISGLRTQTAILTNSTSISPCEKLAGTLPSTVTACYQQQSTSQQTAPFSQPLHHLLTTPSEVLLTVIGSSSVFPSTVSTQGSSSSSQSHVIRTVQSSVNSQPIVSVITSTKRQVYRDQKHPPGMFASKSRGCRTTTEQNSSGIQNRLNKIVLGLPANPIITNPQIVNPLDTSCNYSIGTSFVQPSIVQNTSPSFHSVVPRPTRSPLAQAMSTHASSPFVPKRSLFTSLLTPIQNGPLQTSMPVSTLSTPVSTLSTPQLSLSSPKDAVDELWSIIQQQAQQVQNVIPVEPPSNTLTSLHSYAAPYPSQDTARTSIKRPAEDNLSKRVGAKRRKSPHRFKRVWFDEFGQLHSDGSPPVSPQKQLVAGTNVPRPSGLRIKNTSGPRMKMPSHSSDSQEDEIDNSRPTEKSDSAKTELMEPHTDQEQSHVRLTRVPSRLMAKSKPPPQNKAKQLLAESNKENSDASSPSPPRALQVNDGYKLLFEVKSDDGFETRAESMVEAWHQVVEKVQERRNDMRMKSLSFAGVDAMKMLGIKHDALVFLVEQLFGAKNCKRYRFKFHQRHAEASSEAEPPLNPHGCARAEPFKSRSHHDIFDFLASRHRHKPELEEDTQEQDVQHKSSKRATSLDLPMAMRFRHLKETAKEAVGVYRSLIDGRGLFCKRQIEAGEMVIEYSGNVIRSMLTDKREKYYESKGIGCYMFRIDDFDVVDATVHGNAARFINHSCEPNCFSRVIQVDGKKHIVIFASRKILKGEELTYDYKFPIEDVKIPCNCGAMRCRKYLN